MGRVCTICASPDRVAVDEAIVAGRSQREVARTFELAEPSVQRHSKSHLSPALIAVQARRDERHAVKLVDRLDRVVAKVEAQIDAAEEAGQSAQMLAAAREFRSGLELLARLTGELDERPVTTVNILASDELAQVVLTLMRALGPFPEARIVAAAALNVAGVPT